MEGIRKPAVAGLFYPGSSEELKTDVKKLLGENKLEFSPEKIFGLIAPHAGYIYSGKTAAFAYNLLEGKSYDTVVVVAPSHREYFPGISIYSGEAYETPLGKIPVNKELSNRLIEEHENIFGGLIGHGDHEHSLEVQLPFLQTVLSDFSILPIIVGDQSELHISILAEALSKIYNEKMLIIASTDLSHFHEKAEARSLDNVVVNHINNLDPDSLIDDLDKNKCEACGGGPMVVLLKAALLNNINKSKVLHISDSGDTTGDNTGVVGYLSAVLYD